MKTHVTLTALVAAGILAGVVVFASAAYADSVTIYNTGVDDDGVPLADNAVDPHWTLSGTGPAEGQGPEAIVATDAGGWPVAAGVWLTDDADSTSRWLVPAEDTNGPGATDGTAIYQFTTAFTTPIGGTITISGMQSADNGVVDVQVDADSGTFTPIGFNAFADFSITADITGTDHTLDFFVHNGTGEANPDGPLGFRARITGIDFAPIPEPSTLVLAVLGLLGLAWYGRRKRAA